MCQMYIRRHILRLKPTKLFTTRELLKYGKRAAVDQTLYRMVKEGFLKRVARGVFVRKLTKLPSIKQIARAKAEAFGRTIYKHANRILKKMRLLNGAKPPKGVFAVNAHSSSFMTMYGRVILKQIGPRKVRLCANKSGKMLYAFWHLGKDRCTELSVVDKTRRCNRAEKLELEKASALMPAWLNHLCQPLYRYRVLL
jgi:hypothetical protein